MIAHIESEKSVLGAMLKSPTAVGLATERLRPDDFADPANREVFSNMLTLALSGKNIDLTTLDAELTRRGKLDMVGGAGYLVELARTVPSAVNVEAYIDIVLEKAKLRAVLMIAEAINRRATDDANADKLIELIEGACNDITSRAQQRDGGWIDGCAAAMLAYEAAETDLKPIPTGFAELDEMLCGGLVAPELTIVGARPGKGKSAFLLAASMEAVRKGFHVGYFSLEMSALQIGQRELASSSLVGIGKQRRGNKALTDQDWAAMLGGLDRLAADGMKERLHFYQSYGLTIERLANIARHAVRRGEMDLLVIDYLQLLKTTEKTNAEYERLGTISKGLKQLALALDIPILTAAQVRRQSQDDSKKGGRAPTLDELRGSGDLEQDADNVLLIHSPDNPDDPTLKHMDPSSKHWGIWERSRNAIAMPFMVDVAKQRQGPNGRTWCLFKAMNMRFFEDGGK